MISPRDEDLLGLVYIQQLAFKETLKTLVLGFDPSGQIRTCTTDAAMLRLLMPRVTALENTYKVLQG